MATTTLKDQYPEDIGDGALTIITYPDSWYVTVVAKQAHHRRGDQSVYLILDKQELINALKEA